MNIETLDLRTLSEADARAIADLLILVWPKKGRTLESWLQSIRDAWGQFEGPVSQSPRSLIIRQEDRIVVHALMKPRTIGTEQGEMTILALARVCVAPDLRGQNLGQAIVRAVFESVDEGVFPFALFQTTEPVQPFYERLGACTIENRVINSFGPQQETSQESPFRDPVVMRYPSGPGWPEGEIDLRGPGY